MNKRSTCCNLLVGVVVTILSSGAVIAQDKAALAQAPIVPQMLVDADGTLHFGPRSLPPPALASAEARQAYADQMLDRARAAGIGTTVPTSSDETRQRILRGKLAALKTYPVDEASEKIGGVNVTIYSPKITPPKNRKRVALEFEIDAEAIAVANLAQMKVIKVNYRGGGPSIPGNEDIVAVYRELLKTYTPQNIGMFGTSGGCTLAQTTVLWLPQQKLPMPGAVGLNTCSGGSNPGDSRFTNNGLDATLSTVFTGQPPAGRRAVTRKPTDPPATALDGDIPTGYPPAFLLSGTRDMCLSQTVLLHRKLRNAGVDADLNIFEGMWHVFYGNPDLPESREAMTALAKFFDRHLGK
jgi:monoterpene epsilon-lactone hydrolase